MDAQQTEQAKKAAEQLLQRDGKIVHKWFEEIWPEVALIFEDSPESFATWLEMIKDFSGTHWELFFFLLKESPGLLKSISLNQYDHWLSLIRFYAQIDRKAAQNLMRLGLCQFSDLLAEQCDWLLADCRKLQQVNWEGGLAYFEYLPQVIQAVGQEKADCWKEQVFIIANNHPVLLKNYIIGSYKLIGNIGGEEIRQWLQSAVSMNLEISSRTANSFLVLSPEVFLEAEKEGVIIFDSWKDLVFLMGKAHEEAAESFMHQSFEALRHLSAQQLLQWGELGLRIAQREGISAKEFFISSIDIVKETGYKDLERWAEAGLEVMEDRRLRLFFSRRSKESTEALKAGQLSLSLEKIYKTLQAMLQASFGQQVVLRETGVLPEGTYQEQADLPTCDGYRIYLPSKVSVFEDQELNFKLYKIMLFHQATLLTSGTLEGLEWSGDSTMNTDSERLYWEILQLVIGRNVDNHLLSINPGLKKDLKIILGELVKNLQKLDESQLEEAAVKELIVWSLPIFAEESPAFYGNGENVKDTADEIFQSLARTLDTSKLCRLLVSFRAAYRGIIVKELVEVEGLIKKQWDETGGDVDSIGLIKSLGSRFIQDKAVTFIRFLVKKLIHLHQQEAQEGFARTIFYDEWDWTLEDYKRDWCRVREIHLQPTLVNKVDSILEEHRSLITLMRRYFAMLRPDRVKRLKRQPQGDHVDMDAVVEALVERRQGMGNAENLYIWRDKRSRDVAVAFLMDCSGSTIEEISAGKTILDLEKEAVIIMAEALEMLGDNFAVYSFSSDGRLQVDFQVVKEFDQVYDDNVRQRFGSLKSMEMTRLAAAVRHAVEKMKRVKAAVKLLFILSDGRPYDMDYRAREQDEKSIGQWLRQDEMLYPQEDTRMALWEAKSNGITPFCLTVDKQAKQYMDKIFGQVGYVLINDVDMLPAKLPEIYRRLTT
ncbi:nitric oxide reductase activation protein NorD [Candidatus Contubernalis alkaliaceticus]|uniref:nitric oxide reductase activation protein NorD n=1 Tax=Candidatus Contubernalis alkaliaceticus TaxID=338645 RepID=UPI001F4C43AE|nr:VWA domain-containing protein [Candidatus Contubernalis alkalaceticus]UNC91572.1 hypothetical protein HUE98_05405 [Candidatus Contubernalis alkalaceticus]